ncbi:MAG: LysR family transcriptional regulator, partial [Mesorhizobium sp.]
PWPGPMRTAPLTMIWRRRRVQPPALRQLLTAARDTLVPVSSPAKAGSGLESANRSKALFANNF